MMVSRLAKGPASGGLIFESADRWGLAVARPTVSVLKNSKRGMSQSSILFLIEKSAGYQCNLGFF